MGLGPRRREDGLQAIVNPHMETIRLVKRWYRSDNNMPSFLSHSHDGREFGIRNAPVYYQKSILTAYDQIPHQLFHLIKAGISPSLETD
jgi:hypothetical protein